MNPTAYRNEQERRIDLLPPDYAANETTGTGHRPVPIFTRTIYQEPPPALLDWLTHHCHTLEPGSNS